MLILFSLFWFFILTFKVFNTLSLQFLYVQRSLTHPHTHTHYTHTARSCLYSVTDALTVLQQQQQQWQNNTTRSVNLFQVFLLFFFCWLVFLSSLFCVLQLLLIFYFQWSCTHTHTLRQTFTHINIFVRTWRCILGSIFCVNNNNNE